MSMAVRVLCSRLLSQVLRRVPVHRQEGESAVDLEQVMQFEFE